MKKYSISPPLLMLMAAFILIDGSLLSLYTVLCALWHELWHIIALGICGGRVKKLHAKAMGFSLKTNRLSYKQEAAVALAGPLSSLIAFLFFALVSYFNHMPKTAVFVTASNLALFILNILPLWPLDGGRVLLCMLCQRFDEQRALKITKIISSIFLLPLCAISVIILVESGYNLSLIIVCIYLLLLLLGVINI